MGLMPSEKAMEPPLSIHSLVEQSAAEKETPTQLWAGRILAYQKNPESTTTLPQVVFRGDLQTAQKLYLRSVLEEILKSDSHVQYLSQSQIQTMMEKHPNEMSVGRDSLTYYDLSISTTARTGKNPQEILITGTISKRK